MLLWFVPDDAPVPRLCSGRWLILGVVGTTRPDLDLDFDLLPSLIPADSNPVEPWLVNNLSRIAPLLMSDSSGLSESIEDENTMRIVVP